MSRLLTELQVFAMSSSRVNINAPSLLAWDVGQEAPVSTGQESHVVQLYSDDGLLLDALSRFIAGAIAVGDAAINAERPFE
jgi:hypothetical protein